MSINSPFTTKQLEKLLILMRAIMRSKFLDPSNPPTERDIMKSYRREGVDMRQYYKPDAYDFHNPEVWCKELWYQYVTQAAIHDRPSNKKKTKRLDVSKGKKKVIKELAKHLGHTPTASDLKQAFPSLTELDDEICQAIDKDLSALVRV